MKSFIHEDFFCYRLMLPGNCIMIMQKKQPIIDYHCHLNPEYIAKDHVFDNLGQIWLEGDHYKWRAMRTNGGVEERYCTGKDTSDWEKFENGPKRFLTLCEIHCITGLIWS